MHRTGSEGAHEAVGATGDVRAKAFDPEWFTPIGAYVVGQRAKLRGTREDANPFRGHRLEGYWRAGYRGEPYSEPVDARRVVSNRAWNKGSARGGDGKGAVLVQATRAVRCDDCGGVWTPSRRGAVHGLRQPALDRETRCRECDRVQYVDCVGRPVPCADCSAAAALAKEVRR